MDQEKFQRVVIRRTRPTYSKEHKVGFLFIASVGGLALLFGIFFLFDHLGSPFDLSYVGPEFLTASQERAREIEKQKSLDTDKDSLSDYDELYVYKTSPYLRDTDGDGYSDDTEIKIGTDPNCKGNLCMDEDVAATTSDLFGDVDTNTNFMSDLQGGMSSNSDLSQEETIEAFKNLNAQEVRELLAAAGIDEATIAAMSDEQVMALYESALAEVESGTMDLELQSIETNSTNTHEPSSYAPQGEE